MTSKDALASVRKYYVVTDLARGAGWRLDCRECQTAYALKRRPDGGMHVGNILALLNHAYSHFPEDQASECVE